ncbi:PAS domain S-box-containing protein/diguanylate cyclase (GGDEF) domain-containing protein [Caloramator quimbayensis]|uniref:PAS domain S-box-containing protein/diguanylate cyclase (GGDEF) domain-containing protein n=1 Tax=Caloramator quimbayensis TaxID=1147123 RepID=A0A1T4WQ21_9CLOT|nr:HD domain-containing phosphohydrolase [Caloramator quimbayensis]SKA79349.1 PAS domain S-box-containing protein/diguanylate cyclase (GGDEF) domain-containing protein [Caloramator quimbayensis]
MKNIFRNIKKFFGFNILFILAIVIIVFQLYYTDTISQKFYEQVEFEKRLELKQKVDIAYNTILPIIEKIRKGEITKEKATKEITDIVSRMTYDENGFKNYIFMSSYDGTYFVQPFEPDNVGKNFYDYKDPNGTYVIRELIKAAKEHPMGHYITYLSFQSDYNEYRPKLSYVRGIPEINAYIGTGMYSKTAIESIYKLLDLMRVALILILIFILFLFYVYTRKLLFDNKLLEGEIDKRQRAESELIIEKKNIALKNEYLKTLFYNSPDAIAEFDENNIVVDVNESFEKLFQYKKEECIGKDIDYLVSSENRYSDAKEITNDVYKKGYVFTEGIRFTKYKRPISVKIRGLLIKVDDKNVGGYGIYTDISEQKRYEKKLEYFSFHDSLTKLYNYSYFYSQMNNYSKEEALPLSIIMADVNGLKLVNDTMGHAYGDKLLKSFANILLLCKRKEDTAIRLGGDEFVLIMPNTNKSEAIKVLNNINKEIESYNEKLDEKILRLSIATGLAIKKDLNKTVEDVLKQADDNMYKNKLLDKTSSKNHILNVLIAALGEKDYITKGHTERVSKLCRKMIKKLDIDYSKLNNLMLLSDVHDLGKVAIPDNILNKPEPLTDEEWNIMKSHCEKGYKIALSTPELAGIADLILKHHERWDGKGYPLGIMGDEIPIECRILSIVDSYDAMTSKRPYNNPKTHKEALEEIKRCSGTQFDPELAEIFVSDDMWE